MPRVDILSTKFAIVRLTQEKHWVFSSIIPHLWHARCHLGKFSSTHSLMHMAPKDPRFGIGTGYIEQS